MILIALPWSGILGLLCSTTTSRDFSSDELIFSVLPISPSPSWRLQEFPSCKGLNNRFSMFWKIYLDPLVLLWISVSVADGDLAAWRVTVGFLVEMILGPTDDWDSAFLMISSIKVDCPRGTDPLDFSDLSGGIKSLFALLFLVIDIEI